MKSCGVMYAVFVDGVVRCCTAAWRESEQFTYDIRRSIIGTAIDTAIRDMVAEAV